MQAPCGSFRSNRKKRPYLSPEMHSNWTNVGHTSRGFPGGSMVKNLPVIQETWVQSLGREDLLEEGMATQTSTLAWRKPWTEEPGGLQDWSDLAQHGTGRMSTVPKPVVVASEILLLSDWGWVMCSPSGNRSDALPEADGWNMEKLMCSWKNQCPIQF